MARRSSTHRTFVISLQSFLAHARRVVPRGWTPLIRALARRMPALQRYRAQLKNGDFIYLDLRERMCFGLLYHGTQPHEVGAEKLFHQVLKDGAVLIDVGANIGYYTRLGSRLVGSRGHVLAFEPMPSAHAVLELNTRDLGNVTVSPVALGEHEGLATFYVRQDGDKSSLGPSSDATPAAESLRTMDAVLGDRDRIDLIKIDVEGFELDVLRGASGVIRRLRPVIYFEFLKEYAEERGVDVEDYRTYLQAFAYSLNWIDHSASRRLVSEEQTTYLVAFPNERLDELQVAG